MIKCNLIRFGIFIIIFCQTFQGFHISNVMESNQEQSNHYLESKILSKNEIQYNQKIIVKRSFSTGLELNKIFRNSGRSNNFSCTITFRVLPSNFNYTNMIFRIFDDRSGLKIKTEGGMQFERLSDIVNTSFTYTGFEQFQSTYDFYLNSISGEIVKSVSVYDRNILLLSESACIRRANFSENMTSDYAVFILFGLVLLIPVVILLRVLAVFYGSDTFLKCFKFKKSSSDPNEFSSIIFQRNIKDCKSIFNVLMENNCGFIKEKLHYCYLYNARKKNTEITKNFNEYNQIILQKWLDRFLSKQPNSKSNVENMKSFINNEEINIRKKYEGTMEGNKKKINKEFLFLKQKNSNKLSSSQNEERDKYLEVTKPKDLEIVKKSMSEIFEKQNHDLCFQTDFLEEFEMEKDKFTNEQKMENEMFNCEISGVKKLIMENYKILNEEPNQTNLTPEGNEIYRNYLILREKLFSIKEIEKIREMANLEYIAQVMENLVNLKAIETNNIHEVLDRKCENFIDFINSLISNEIDKTTGRSMIEEFERDKLKIFNDVEKIQTDQIKSLMMTSEENKKRKMDELILEHDNIIKKLVIGHQTNDNINELLEEIENANKKYYEKVIETESITDTECTNKLIEICNQNAKEIMQKLDEKIMQLLKELESEGIEAGYILKNFNEKIIKLTKMQEVEKQKQIQQMKEKLQNTKKQIDKSVKEQIHNQKNQNESENNIFDEILNLPKCLSGTDRDNILKKYAMERILSQNSITNCYLEQKKRMDGLLMANKWKKLNELEVKHNEKVETLIDYERSINLRKTDSEIRKECEGSLLVEYLDEKLEILRLCDWKEDLNKELEAIRKELIDERMALLNKKDEETVALILQIQMMETKETLAIKEENEKLSNLQLAFIETNTKLTGFEEIFNSYLKSKDRLEEEFTKIRSLQERNFRKRLEKNLLKSQNNKQDKQKKQEYEDLMVKDQIKLDISLQKVEKDLLRKFISAANYRRDDIVTLMVNIYPLKLNEEIEEMVEELYPKNTVKNEQTTPVSGKSLLEAYRNFTEEIKQSSAQASQEFAAKASFEPETDNLDNTLTDTFTEKSFIEPEANHDEDLRVVSENENNKKKKRKKKRKIRQKIFNENEDFDEEK